MTIQVCVLPTIRRSISMMWENWVTGSRVEEFFSNKSPVYVTMCCLLKFLPLTHKHTHTYSDTDTQAHTQTHKHIHKHIHTHTSMRIHTFTLFQWWGLTSKELISRLPESAVFKTVDRRPLLQFQSTSKIAFVLYLPWLCQHGVKRLFLVKGKCAATLRLVFFGPSSIMLVENELFSALFGQCLQSLDVFCCVSDVVYFDI